MLRMTTILIALAASSSAFAETSPIASKVPDGSAGDARSIDRSALRRALVEQRKVNLARFHDYRRHKVYPHNTYEPGMLNVWRDADEHLCAVATLVHLDGRDDLVDALAKEQNFVKTADLTGGPLLDWVLTSGFTQEEIVMIQQPTAEEVEAEERAYRAEQRRIKRRMAREDRRLASVYKTVETTLATERIADAGLDLATARLAERPELAAALIARFPAH